MPEAPVSMNAELPTNCSTVDRVLDVVENDILPLTVEGVRAGNKIFGAAILDKSDQSLVLAETNDEARDPLLHGEVNALMRFHQIPENSRPAPERCLFIATHEPCPLCLSALAWSGFDNFYFVFSHEQSRDLFGIPHDARIMQEVFGLEPGGYNKNNAYWKSFCLAKLAAAQAPPEDLRLRNRIAAIEQRYVDLTRSWEKHRATSRIPLR
jgi:tRNA(Arg) A34 adenosine deaminase TadA